MTATQDDLFRFLDELGIETTTVEHPPLFTVEQSQGLRGAIAGRHSKNLFLKDKKGAIFLVVAEEDAAIDLKRLHERIGASGRLSFGSAELMQELLGVTPGSVTPFGVLNDREARVQVVLDDALAAPGPVNFHPLVNTATTTIAAPDLVAFLRATGHEPLLLSFSPASASPDL
ncbi:DNA-binding protein [Kaistia sp. 32K]|uniref:prolyl-tRNA synthetase associated domain-containing protein n=1 Tax=Kaistia sp. 32K TaxID=2795690 RepID=UPI0019152827|nr:prolyl-tRNA synthetase associated domain-containing protein [Kaistia sp. 32K]BCP55759.1 DNA-binding protein [Kaistia sp. 32K]